MKKGVLLINLGTPDQCDARSVRTYLREFLNDPRVIDLPWYIRWPLVNLLIIPFRFQKTTHAYKQVWTSIGSPLTVHMRELTQALAQQLGPEHQVVYGMRYGNPSIASALKQLSHCESMVVLPLFPQYSSAATGSALQEFYRCLLPQWNMPSLRVIHDFYCHPGFIQAVADKMVEVIQVNKPDLVLFSYHGLPERHIQKSQCEFICEGNVHCRGENSCPAVGSKNRFCYRAQCYETTRLVAQKLGLQSSEYTVSFQSRLGKTPWITPYTDLLLPELIKRGVRRLAIVCPSFVSDCLETLEEINMRAREQWLALGGEDFTYIPCVNESSEWIAALSDMLS